MRKIRLFAASMLAAVMGHAVMAQPTLIPFQGHLTQPRPGSEDEFEPAPNGVYSVAFAFYTSPAGGEGLVWGPERHTNVVVVNGLVNVLLGSIDDFETELSTDPNFFRRTLYVGVSIDEDGDPGTTDLEMIPRQLLLPAVQAFNSDKLDGRDWRDFFDGTDEEGIFTPGVTKARDANLFDGIDSAAVFVDPTDTATPKVIRAQTADAVSGDLNLSESLTVNGNVEIGGNLIVNGTVESDLNVVGEVRAVSASGESYLVPRGTIGIWSGLISDIPDGWALCDGSNGTPDLRDRFVQGAGTDEEVNEIGGSTSHTHSFSGTTGNRGATAGAIAVFSSGNDWFTETHNHSFSGTTGSTDHLPPYLRLAYIMRI